MPRVSPTKIIRSSWELYREISHQGLELDKEKGRDSQLIEKLSKALGIRKEPSEAITQDLRSWMDGFNS